MKKQAEHAPDSNVSETIVARIEINELADPVRQNKIVDAVTALSGVIESKIEKGALHVSYDPLATTEAKIKEAVRSSGNTIKAAATDTQAPHPDLPKPTNVEQTPVEDG